jgi:ABC-type uncharacterized transport system substrate-binding protein
MVVAPGAATEPAKRVFIVQSQEKGHVCGQPQAEGVLEALAEAGWQVGGNLTVRFHYMDYYGANATRDALHADGQRTLAEIEEFDPDLVFTLDDGAIKEVMMPLVGRLDIAVVFSGMNAEPEAYNRQKEFMTTRARPGANVTGVLEKLYTAESVAVMAHAVPGLRGGKVVLMTDLTVTGDALTKQFEKELQGVDDVTWEVKRIGRWEEYTALIEAANDDPAVKAIYPLALTMEGPNGERYTAPRIYDWTLANSRKPEMAANYFFARMGFFGGAVVNFRAMGRMAGRKGAQILHGAKPGDFAIEDASDYAIVFNVKRAKDLGIDIPTRVLTAADAVYQDDLMPLEGRPLVYDPTQASF